MSQDGYQPLDDKYRTGVYYDMSGGDFCQIQYNEDEETVELVNPENDEVYWTLTLEEWHTDAREDMRPVLGRAVENPQSVIQESLDMLGRNDPNELMSISEEWAIGLRYARTQVTL